MHFSSVDHFREHLLLLIQQFDTWGVSQKLLLNEKISYGQHSPEGILRLLGWVHLYTASGIHLYAFLEMFDYLLKKLTRFKVFGIELPLEYLKLLLKCTVFMTFMFLWMLQKFRFGFLRPMLAFGLRQLATSLGIKWSFLSPLMLVLFLDYLIGDQYSGQLHYYLAVGGGIVTVALFGKRLTPAKTHVLLAFGSWIWIAVFELFTEYRVALWTPFFSLITLPILCTLIYPMLIFSLFHKDCFLFLGDFTTQTLSWFIKLMDQCALSFYVIDAACIPLAVLFALCFTIFFFALPLWRKELFVISLLLLCFGRFVPLDKGLQTKTAIQLDVGQGDALLIKEDRPQGRVEMIDVGSKRTQKPEKLLIELCRAGVRRIDGILFSHLDEDHAGMLPVLKSIIPIDCVESYLSPIRCVKMIEHVWLKDGKHGRGNKIMAGSLVELDPLTVYLAAGDADEIQEEKFIAAFAERARNYKRRIWKVSHHGSKFSTTKKLFQSIRPTEAWISAGRKNRYGHPHPQTIYRLNLQKIPIYWTAEGGSVRSKPTQPSLEKITL